MDDNGHTEITLSMIHIRKGELNQGRFYLMFHLVSLNESSIVFIDIGNSTSTSLYAPTPKSKTSTLSLSPCTEGIPPNNVTLPFLRALAPASIEFFILSLFSLGFSGAISLDPSASILFEGDFTEANTNTAQHFLIPLMDPGR